MNASGWPKGFITSCLQETKYSLTTAHFSTLLAPRFTSEKYLKYVQFTKWNVCVRKTQRQKALAVHWRRQSDDRWGDEVELSKWVRRRVSALSAHCRHCAYEKFTRFSSCDSNPNVRVSSPFFLLFLNQKILYLGIRFASSNFVEALNFS